MVEEGLSEGGRGVATAVKLFSDGQRGREGDRERAEGVREREHTREIEYNEYIRD